MSDVEESKTVEYTFETETGGLNKAHYATAETAEAMAVLIRAWLGDSYTATVDYNPKYDFFLYPPMREVWVRKDNFVEHLNAGLVANTVMNHGEDPAKECIIAELRYAGADL